MRLLVMFLCGYGASCILWHVVLLVERCYRITHAPSKRWADDDTEWKVR